MVLGCMSATGVGNICFLKISINTDVYQDVLNHLQIPHIEKMFRDNEFTFQHDLAPSYRAKFIKEWFKEKKLVFD